MNVSLGESIVMPDHFHAIIFIGMNSFNSNYRIAEPSIVNLEVLSEEISTEIPDIFIHNFKSNAFGPQSNNLASIIRGFKWSVTTFARKNEITFNWQSSFHCRVIQSINDLEKVNLYIENNVKNWRNK